MKVIVVAGVVGIVWGLSAEGTLLRSWLPASTPSTVKLEQEMQSSESFEPFLKSFEATIHKLPPAEQQQIEAGILQKAEGETEELAEEAGGCAVDYAAPCPRGWLPRVDRETAGEYCDAPKDYKGSSFAKRITCKVRSGQLYIIGYCEASKSFDFYTEDAKADWAKSCEASWPCKGDDVHSCRTGSRDFTLPCPEGFNIRADGETCEAEPGRYTGLCPLAANFGSFSDDAKRAWSVTCGAYWPCRQDCVLDYDAVCPEGWTDEGSFWCGAPASYSAGGRCASRWNFKYFTRDMKRAFERSCQAKFPCEDTCEKEYTLPCPKGWTEEEKTCKASTDNTACGINRVAFTFMTLQEKKSFERDCHASWPCKAIDACEINWQHPCPKGWIVLPPAGKTLREMMLERVWLEASCEPPATVAAECSVKEAFLSEAEKRKFASMCNLTWPCVEPLPAMTYKAKEFLGVLAAQPPASGLRPRPPTPVTDRREIQKRGPVHDVTGEVWPRRPRQVLPFTRIVGKEPKREAPVRPSRAKILALKEAEKERSEAARIVLKPSRHRGYYGGLAVGFHLLGSSS